MDESAFEATHRLLEQAGLQSRKRKYDRQAFGSWFVELSSRPPLRVVWDGKDGWLILQERTEEAFHDLPVWKDLKVVKETRAQTPESVVSLVTEALRQRDPSGSTIEHLPPQESSRRMVAGATDQSYKGYASLLEARTDPDAVAILEGDDGGQLYAVIPVHQIQCSPDALHVLLADLDAIAWPGNHEDMKHVYFEHQPVGTGIPGGMGGARSTGQLWIHEEFRKMGLAGDIAQVLAGKRDRIRTGGRDRELP